MRGSRKKLTGLLHFALCIFLFILVSACGEGIYTTPETGSIAFSVEWEGAPQESPGRYTAALDCAAAGISTVEAQVYNENDTYLAAGGPWDCEAHQGTIAGVPAGSNRKVVILGKDSSGNVLYRGEVTDITVTAGQTNDAGEIVANLFCPTPTAPEDGSTVTNGAFSFEWNPIARGSEYQIQVSTGSTFETTAIDTTTVSTTYAPPELSYGETYYWRVKAKDSYGNQSIWSDVWSFTVSTEPGIAPSAPTNVTAAGGDGQVSIRWDSVSGATSYNIYWATWSGVSKTDYQGEIEDITTTSYTHTGLTNDTTYYYVVTAQNSYGECDESTEVSATPSATSTSPSTPTNVTATAGDGEVTISWGSVPGATRYNIYWATSDGVSKTVYDGKIEDITETSYTHTGLTNDTTYYYVVTAENSYGESGESSEVSATPSATGTAPSAPTNVSAAPGDGQAWISWDSVSGATSYNIYWATYSGVSKIDYEGKIADITSTAYTHTGLTNGTTYYYVVTAENSYGESDESNEVNVKPSSTWTMLKLPDTGQTQSYTDTFGEDSDYTINAPSYSDNGDGTVTDNVTGLMWQHEDDDTTRTWDDAISYCNDLTLGGYSDWRLPSKKELISIVDYATYNPSIDTTYFPGTNALYYWSSTTRASNSSRAWVVSFGKGLVGNSNKSDGRYVRCVRGGQ